MLVFISDQLLSLTHSVNPLKQVPETCEDAIDKLEKEMAKASTTHQSFEI